MSNITSDPENAAICRAVISLAQELGIAVTAEGVEDFEALEFLKSRNCEQYQGFYYSPAVSVMEFESLLVKERSNHDCVNGHDTKNYGRGSAYVAHEVTNK